MRWRYVVELEQTFSSDAFDKQTAVLRGELEDSSNETVLLVTQAIMLRTEPLTDVGWYITSLTMTLGYRRFLS